MKILEIEWEIEILHLEEDGRQEFQDSFRYRIDVNAVGRYFAVLVAI